MEVTGYWIEKESLGGLLKEAGAKCSRIRCHSGSTASGAGR